jgi:hypothetical protein
MRSHDSVPGSPCDRTTARLSPPKKDCSRTLQHHQSLLRARLHPYSLLPLPYSLAHSPIPLNPAHQLFTIDSRAWDDSGIAWELGVDFHRVQLNTRWVWRLIQSILLVGAGLTLLGCGNSSAVKLFPVQGKVLFKDQPAEGAKVVFLPAGDENAQFRGARPAATVTADGSFEVRTEPHGAGAPAGDYIVLITWFPPRDENPNSNPKNKLPNKYSDQGNPLLKVTVKEGENKLDPFKLTP